MTSQVWAAQESPQGFTFQGRLMTADGSTALTGPVALTLKVLDKNKQCVLYSESHAAVTLTDGKFSVIVGTGTPLFNTYSLAEVFKNDGTDLAGLSGTGCGGNYMSAAGDERYLEVTVDGNTMTNPVRIATVPHAFVAETLQGKYPTDFINTTAVITQGNLNTLTAGTSDASALHHHDGAYLKVNSSTNYNVGSSNIYTTGKMYIGTDAAAPVAASPMLEIKSSSDVVGVRVRGTSAQTAPLQQWFNDDGTAMVTVSATGNITSNVTAGGAEGLMGISSGALGKGVVGQADNSGYGVYGTSSNGYGVFGTSTTGYGGFFYSTGNNIASLAARAGSSGDIQQWLNATGTSVASVDSSGKFIGDGSQLTGITATDSSKVSKAGGDIIANTSDVVGLRIRAFTGQANALQSWINADGTAVATFGADGEASFSGDGSAITINPKTGATYALSVSTSGAINGIQGAAVSGAGVVASSTSGYGIYVGSETGPAGYFIHTGNSSNPLISGKLGTGSGDLISMYNNEGTAIFRVDKDGKLYGDGSTLSNLASGFADPMTTRGDIIYKNSSGTTTRLPAGAASTVLVSDGTDIAYSTISNAGIAANAAIDFSKLASLSSGNILVGNNLNVATSVAMSGDATIDNTGKLTASSDIARRTAANTFTKQNFFQNDSDTIGLEIKGHSTQTADIMVVRNHDGTALYRFEPGGSATAATGVATKAYVDASTPTVLSNYVKTDGTVAMSGGLNVTLASDTFGASIRAHSTQNANLQQWLNNDGTAIAWIDKDGKIHGDGSQLSGLASGFADPTTTRGDIIYKNSSGTTTRLPAGAASTVLMSDGTDIAYSTISNANIAANAAIDFSKLASLTSGNILVGNNSNVATSVAMSGDATIDNTGKITASSDIARRTEANTFTKQNIIDADSNTTALIVKADGSQSVDIMQITNHDGTALVRVGSDGKLYGDGSQLSGLSAGFADPMTTRGDIIYKDSSGTTTRLPAGGASTVLVSDGTDITYSTISNANIAANAAIDFSKLASLSSGNILVGNNSNVATSVAMSGDATIDDTGKLTTSSDIARRTEANTFTKQNIIDADSNTTALIVKADGSQSVDIMQITNHDGTALVRVGSDGKLYGDGSQLSGLSAGFADPMTTRGDVIYKNSLGTTTRLPAGAASTVLVSDGTDIAYSTISNASIAANAAIDFSKLASLSSGNILVGNNSNVATSVAMSGDATIDDTGKLTTSSDIARRTADNTFTKQNLFHNDSDTIGLVVKGHSTQTTDIMMVRNNDGTALYRFEPGGSATAATGVATKAYVDSSTPTVLSNYVKADGTVAMSGGLNVTLTSDTYGASIRAHSTQNANLQQWLNNDGTAMVWIDKDGKIHGDGTEISGVSASDSTKVSKTGGDAIANSSDVVGLSIRGFSSQTANLFRWINGNGTALGHIGYEGQIESKGVIINDTVSTATLSGPNTFYAVGFDADDTSLTPLGVPTNYADSGYLYIQDYNGSDEIIHYTSRDGTTFNGITRGVAGTTASDHTNHISASIIQPSFMVMANSVPMFVVAQDSIQIDPHGYGNINIGGTVTPLTVKQNDTGNLQTWLTTNGTAIAAINANGVLTRSTKHSCVTIENFSASDSNLPIWSTPYATTILSGWCTCQGTCTTPGQFVFEDNSDNAMTGTVTCAANTADAPVSVTSGGLTAYEVLRIQVSNTPAPTSDTYTICWTYRYD